jgi:hypothetical protein
VGSVGTVDQPEAGVVMPARGQYSDVVSYSQAHLRLKTDRGRADQYECISCGGQAREWAYMGDGSDALTDDLGRLYSTDQTAYEPMCVACHRRHDRAVADGRPIDECPRGHKWDEANTGIRRSRSKGVGLRFCRACHRENAAERRERLRMEAA